MQTLHYKKIKTLFSMVLISSAVLISGCGGPFADYSDKDLREEFRKCDYNKLSPAGAQRCNNLKKECDARKKDKGFRC